jgi:predicted ATP-grasp superfamily ATP-dependent carboligase
MTERLNYLASPELVRPALIVGWRGDAGNLGERTISYLNESLALKSLAEIEPVGFFPLSGVEVSNDLARLPDSRFYYSETAPVITLLSDIPVYEVHLFLKLVLDLAARFVVSHIVVLGGLATMASHNTPSQLLANLSTPLLKEWLSDDGINTGIDYVSPSGQKPAIATYLTWEARQRGIEALSLWQPVPFYLAPFNDEGGAARLLSFFRQKLALPVDSEPLAEAAKKQREKLAGLRSSTADVEKYLNMLESNLSLTEYEAGALAAVVRQAIGPHYQ